MVFSGNQVLTGTMNYFWLVYDISCTATNTNVIDAQLDNYMLGAGTVIPPTIAPAGTRSIIGYPNANGITQPLTTVTNAGSVNNQVLRYDMSATTCGNLTSMTFANLSTVPAEVTAARVFYTTTTTFSNAVQFGTAVNNPGGTFTITGNQPLTAAASYLWLVYDVACSAPSAATNIVDASLTSFNIGTTTLTPTTTNPVGTRTISGLASTFVTTQSSTAVVAQSSINNQIVRLAIPTSVCGGVTSVTFNTMGTTAVADIAKARVFVTTTTTFSTAVQFGTDITSPSGNMVFTGTQDLSATTTYFWLVYDISCSSATATNVVDATILSATIGGTPSGVIAASQAPTGTRTLGPNTPGATVQASTSVINSGMINSPLIYFPINANGCNNLTQVVFNTGATSNVADLATARAFLVPSTTIFSLGNLNLAQQFGAAIVNPNGTLTFTGNAPLNTALIYYVYIAFDLSCTAPAAAANVIDANAVSFTLTNTSSAATTLLTPSVLNPVGTRTINALTTSTIPNDNLCNAVDITSTIYIAPATEEKFSVLRTSADGAANKTCTPTNSGATLECQQVSPAITSNFTMNHWGTAAGGGSCPGWPTP